MGGDGPSAKMIADTLQEMGVRLGMVIDECGGCSDGQSEKVDRPVCDIVVGEKGYADFALIAEDEGGHSSTPGTESPMVRMGQALQALWASPCPVLALCPWCRKTCRPWRRTAPARNGKRNCWEISPRSL